MNFVVYLLLLRLVALSELNKHDFLLQNAEKIPYTLMDKIVNKSKSALSQKTSNASIQTHSVTLSSIQLPSFNKHPKNEHQNKYLCSSTCLQVSQPVLPKSDSFNNEYAYSCQFTQYTAYPYENGRFSLPSLSTHEIVKGNCNYIARSNSSSYTCYERINNEKDVFIQATSLCNNLWVPSSRTCGRLNVADIEDNTLPFYNYSASSKIPCSFKSSQRGHLRKVAANPLIRSIYASRSEESFEYDVKTPGNQFLEAFLSFEQESNAVLVLQLYSDRPQRVLLWPELKNSHDRGSNTPNFMPDYTRLADYTSFALSESHKATGFYSTSTKGTFWSTETSGPSSSLRILSSEVLTKQFTATHSSQGSQTNFARSGSSFTPTSTLTSFGSSLSRLYSPSPALSLESTASSWRGASSQVLTKASGMEVSATLPPYSNISSASSYVSQTSSWLPSPTAIKGSASMSSRTLPRLLLKSSPSFSKVPHTGIAPGSLLAPSLEPLANALPSSSHYNTRTSAKSSIDLSFRINPNSKSLSTSLHSSFVFSSSSKVISPLSLTSPLALLAHSINITSTSKLRLSTVSNSSKYSVISFSSFGNSTNMKVSESIATTSSSSKYLTAASLNAPSKKAAIASSPISSSSFTRNLLPQVSHSSNTLSISFSAMSISPSKMARSDVKSKLFDSTISLKAFSTTLASQSFPVLLTTKRALITPSNNAAAISSASHLVTTDSLSSKGILSRPSVVSQLPQKSIATSILSRTITSISKSNVLSSKSLNVSSMSSVLSNFPFEVSVGTSGAVHRTSSNGVYKSILSPKPSTSSARLPATKSSSSLAFSKSSSGFMSTLKSVSSISLTLHATKGILTPANESNTSKKSVRLVSTTLKSTASLLTKSVSHSVSNSASSSPHFVDSSSVVPAPFSGILASSNALSSIISHTQSARFLSRSISKLSLLSQYLDSIRSSSTENSNRNKNLGPSSVPISIPPAKTTSIILLTSSKNSVIQIKSTVESLNRGVSKKSITSSGFSKSIESTSSLSANRSAIRSSIISLKTSFVLSTNTASSVISMKGTGSYRSPSQHIFTSKTVQTSVISSGKSLAVKNLTIPTEILSSSTSRPLRTVSTYHSNSVFASSDVSLKQRSVLLSLKSSPFITSTNSSAPSASSTKEISGFHLHSTSVVLTTYLPRGSLSQSSKVKVSTTTTSNFSHKIVSLDSFTTNLFSKTELNSTLAFITSKSAFVPPNSAKFSGRTTLRRSTLTPTSSDPLKTKTSSKNSTFSKTKINLSSLLRSSQSRTVLSSPTLVSLTTNVNISSSRNIYSQNIDVTFPTSAILTLRSLLSSLLTILPSGNWSSLRTMSITSITSETYGLSSKTISNDSLLLQAAFVTAKLFTSSSLSRDFSYASNSFYDSIAVLSKSNLSDSLAGSQSFKLFSSYSTLESSLSFPTIPAFLHSNGASNSETKPQNTISRDGISSSHSINGIPIYTASINSYAVTEAAFLNHSSAESIPQILSMTQLQYEQQSTTTDSENPVESQVPQRSYFEENSFSRDIFFTITNQPSKSLDTFSNVSPVSSRVEEPTLFLSSLTAISNSTSSISTSTILNRSDTVTSSTEAAKFVDSGTYSSSTSISEVSIQFQLHRNDANFTVNSSKDIPTNKTIVVATTTEDNLPKLLSKGNADMPPALSSFLTVVSLESASSSGSDTGVTYSDYISTPLKTSSIIERSDATFSLLHSETYLSSTFASGTSGTLKTSPSPSPPPSFNITLLPKGRFVIKSLKSETSVNSETQSIKPSSQVSNLSSNLEVFSKHATGEVQPLRNSSSFYPATKILTDSSMELQSVSSSFSLLNVDLIVPIPSTLTSERFNSHYTSSITYEAPGPNASLFDSTDQTTSTTIQKSATENGTVLPINAEITQTDAMLKSFESNSLLVSIPTKSSAPNPLSSFPSSSDFNDQKVQSSATIEISSYSSTESKNIVEVSNSLTMFQHGSIASPIVEITTVDLELLSTSISVSLDLSPIVISENVATEVTNFVMNTTASPLPQTKLLLISKSQVSLLTSLTPSVTLNSSESISNSATLGVASTLVSTLSSIISSKTKSDSLLNPEFNSILGPEGNDDFNSISKSSLVPSSSAFSFSFSSTEPTSVSVSNLYLSLNSSKTNFQVRISNDTSSKSFISPITSSAVGTTTLSMVKSILTTSTGTSQIPFSTSNNSFALNSTLSANSTNPNIPLSQTVPLSTTEAIRLSFSSSQETDIRGQSSYSGSIILDLTIHSHTMTEDLSIYKFSLDAAQIAKVRFGRTSTGNVTPEYKLKVAKTYDSLITSPSSSLSDYSYPTPNSLEWNTDNINSQSTSDPYVSSILMASQKSLSMELLNTSSRAVNTVPLSTLTSGGYVDTGSKLVSTYIGSLTSTVGSIEQSHVQVFDTVTKLSNTGKEQSTGVKPANQESLLEAQESNGRSVTDVLATAITNLGSSGDSSPTYELETSMANTRSTNRPIEILTSRSDAADQSKTKSETLDSLSFFDVMRLSLSLQLEGFSTLSSSHSFQLATISNEVASSGDTYRFSATETSKSIFTATADNSSNRFFKSGYQSLSRESDKGLIVTSKVSKLKSNLDSLTPTLPQAIISSETEGCSEDSLGTLVSKYLEGKLTSKAESGNASVYAPASHILKSTSTSAQSQRSIDVVNMGSRVSLGLSVLLSLLIFMI